VIHRVGPVYRDGRSGEPELLRSAYRHSLELASVAGARTVAFPCISTGVYGYPKSEACAIAIDSVAGWLDTHEIPEGVVFCCFSPQDAALYEAQRAALSEREASQADHEQGVVTTDDVYGREVAMTATHMMRELLALQLDWGEAHVSLSRAVAGMPEELQGVVPAGFAHSAWQQLEHMRRAQADILDFCVNPDYVYPTSMDEYWPEAAPADDESWAGAVKAFMDDLGALQRLARDESLDLFAPVPAAKSDTQTLARELILVTDHNAYHLGQLLSLRRVLDAWQDGPGWGYESSGRLD